MAKYASLSGESFGVDDTRLKWSFLKGEREKGRKREGEREVGGEGGRGRGRERGREGRGERVLSLSFKGKVIDPANSLVNRSYLLFSSIS